MKLHVAIAIALVAGLALGLLASATGSPALMSAALAVKPIGTAFVSLLRMVVVPLVVSTLFVGVAGLGNLRVLGRMSGITLGFFAVTTLVAVAIGMALMTAFLPLANPEAARAVASAATTEAPPLPGPVDFLIGLIPANPFQAAADGALLPLIVFTSLVGAAVGALPEAQREPLLSLANAVAAAFIKLVHWVLWTAPIGVFALAAPVTAESGWAVLQSLAVFVIAVALGLSLFVGLVYVPAAWRLGRVPPLEFLGTCVGPQVIGFTTTSSAATIPAMLEATERLHVSGAVASLVVSLGAAVGRAGSALFQGSGLVFLAWLYGVSLPLESLGVAVLATALVSITVAGVPSAGVLTLAPVLGTAGVPIDGLAVLLAVDRIPDMLRTATNVTGTITASLVVDRWPGGTAGRSDSRA
jgi:Na+/H+-dicarboxylate symporter